MFIIGNFLLALAKVINLVLGAYGWIVIARALISWVNPDPYNPIVRFLVQVTEPALSRIRKVVPAVGGLDLSPLLLLLAIFFVQTFLVTTLQQMAGAH